MRVGPKFVWPVCYCVTWAKKNESQILWTGSTLLKIINMHSYKDDAMHIKLLKHRSQPDLTVVEMDKHHYYIIHLEVSETFFDCCLWRPFSGISKYSIWIVLNYVMYASQKNATTFLFFFIWYFFVSRRGGCSYSFGIVKPSHIVVTKEKDELTTKKKTISGSIPL